MVMAGGNNNQHYRSYRNDEIFILVTFILAITMDCIKASPDLLPLPCDSIKCPPMDKINCPDDSFIRNLTKNNNLNHYPTTISFHNEIQSSSPTFDSSMNDDEIMNELLSQCCVASKCGCKTCDIPTCGNHSLVIYETIPESQIPGKCCGKYECRPEPDCSEVSNTDGYWLTDCQRCKCHFGERICHKSCDEILKNSGTAFCKSKALNRFFSDGETWKEECEECECHNGEKKCVVPFCRSVNCEKNHQIIPQNGCCPICINEHETGLDIPSSADYDDTIGNNNYDDINGNDRDNNDDDDDDDDENNASELHDFDKFPFDDEFDKHEKNITSHHIADVIITNTTTTTKTTEEIKKIPEIHIVTSPSTISTPTTTTSSTTINPKSSSSSPPCLLNSQDSSSSYAVYPEVVEVVRPANNIDVLYAIIGCLSIAVVALSFIVCQMRAKQRSYRPVSNFDDNFNKPSSNIKKMNDYV